MDELKVYFGIIQAAGTRHDRRLVGRMANRTGALCKSMNKDTCTEVLSVFAPDCPELNQLMAIMPSSVVLKSAPRTATEQAFGWLLAVKYLQEQGMLSVPVARAVCQRVSAMNQRELDPLLARLVHCLVKTACCRRQQKDDNNNLQEDNRNAADIHGDLMNLMRQARLRHDHDTMAVAHNGLARVYLMTGQWEMMGKLFASALFPVNTASHNHAARHHYYAARLAAVKLQYQQAMTSVDQALRKSPHHAHAFKAVCNRLLVVVRLLCGDVPALADLKQLGDAVVHSLHNQHYYYYYQLCKTVRNGDVAGFQLLLQPGSVSLQAFQRDNLEGLILRLHQNVVKAGLKRIAVSYSSIPLVDIQVKLGLDSLEDALMIVMKAVRDGVISGKLSTLAHGSTTAKVFVADKDTPSDAEKADALHNRILSCQSVIQEAVRSMRFPDRKPVGDRSTMELDGHDDGDDAGKELDELDDMVMMEDDFF